MQKLSVIVENSRFMFISMVELIDSGSTWQHVYLVLWGA